MDNVRIPKRRKSCFAQLVHDSEDDEPITLNKVLDFLNSDDDEDVMKKCSTPIKGPKPRTRSKDSLSESNEAKPSTYELDIVEHTLETSHEKYEMNVSVKIESGDDQFDDDSSLESIRIPEVPLSNKDEDLTNGFGENKPIITSVTSLRQNGVTSEAGELNVETTYKCNSAENEEDKPKKAAIGWANDEGSYSFNCGGSLISSRFVLTAGHCTRAPSERDPTPVVVRLRDSNVNPSVNDGARPLDVPIKNIIKHPEYRPPKRYNDIALLELAGSIEFDSYIRPACLWNKNSFDQEKAIATGWGVMDPYRPKTSDELQKVSLSLLDNEYCDQLLFPNRNRNWQGFAPTQLCAGELRGRKDTCQGDSGGPLQLASKENQCIFHIIGVTSFGYKCAGSGKPAIYTRVSSYIEWIESVV